MRIRSVSLLATTLAALLGCPLENMQANPSDDQASSERDDGSSLGFDNSEAHDDAVDAKEDVSWVETGEMARGSGALRVLMTDAPLEADNVFVTICGIHVQPVSSNGEGDAVRGDDTARPEPGTDGSVPRDREETKPADREPDDRGEPGEMLPPDADPGADPNAPADDHPEDDAAMAAGEGEELTDEEREAAERERVEAERERAEAEREAAEAEGRAAPPPSDERDGEPVPDRTDGADGQAPRDSEETTGAPRGWYTVSDQCQTVDLLTLQNGVTEAMGLAQLPAGAYGQIRLDLTEATIVKDGLRQRLEVPSGDQTGIKVVGGFSLYDGEATTITLDFDAGASVVYVEGRGFIMRPVVRLVDVTEHGQDGEEQDDTPRGGGQTQPRPESPEGAAGAPGREPPPPPPPPPPHEGTDPRKPSEEQPEPPSGEPDGNPPGSAGAGAGGSSGSAGAGGAGSAGDSDG